MAQLTNEHPERNLPQEIQHGVELISKGTMKEFVLFMAVGVGGLLGETVCQGTVEGGSADGLR
ncbi:hypothetical protein C8J57DRAFT_1533282 [Mycena rebaudengoi]|nr:hypothetical protein C8J57DRAFT_1533282 [Mycena rebaudengoi]